MAYQQKTLPDAQAVTGFLKTVESEKRRSESAFLMEMMERLTGSKPVLWGPSIIGFGQYHYKYDSGHSGTYLRIGFSPRKAAMTIYMMTGYDNRAALLARLGPHTRGKSCLYVKDLAKIDHGVLEQIAARSLAEMDVRYPQQT